MTSEKLDILMKITDTKNSALGRALSFDPSYIGRIRSGKRGIPKHMPFVEPAAAYFAKNIKTDYQKKLVSEVVYGGKPIPDDKSTLEAIIIRWLNEDNSTKNAMASIDLFLHELAAAGNLESMAPGVNITLNNISEHEAFSTPLYFYGNEGKRKATEIFLSKLCAEKKPHTLLLFSDEDMSWLYENPVFAKKWAGYLFELLSTGSHIKIIHTINRNLNDLMEAIKNWLPLYISGNIEPYYYPRLRDGIYHRTLFLAVDCFAVISSSIGNNTVDMPNLFIDEPNAIKGFEMEFDNYLSLCLPLMKIYKTAEAEKLNASLTRFANSNNEVYYLAASYNTQFSTDKEAANNSDIFPDNCDNLIRINSGSKKIPDNISIIAGIGNGVLVITDKFIFDTTEPSFTMTFCEYLSKI